MKKKTIASLLVLILAIVLVACNRSGSGNNPPSGDVSTAPPTTSGSNASGEATPTPAPSKDKTFGDLIEFDDLEIVFSNEIIWTAVSNQFSDKNGMDVFLVPITIKNTKNETHGLNMFYYDLYGSKGTKLDGVGSFFDGEVGSAGNMRSGAIQEAVMAFLYDGDGDYFVEFSQIFGDTIEVRLPIIWGDNSASPLSDTPASLAPSSESSTSTVAKTFGDIIEFDDLEIVFSSNITWTTVSNQFSDKNGMDVFLVPLTIKNVKDETHGLNMFYYDIYGSQGTKLDSVGSFFDNEVSSAGNMRSGATQEVVMAFLYDGDGEYFVEFSQLFGDTIEVKLPIEK